MRFVAGAFILAALCGSTRVIVPAAHGIGVQRGIVSSEWTSSVLFWTLTELSEVHLFVSTLGLALSLYHRKRNPKRFQLTSIAFATLLVGAIATAAYGAWLTVIFSASATFSQTAIAVFVYRCVSIASQLAAWILLFAALFSRRFDAAAGPSNS
jgi:hypothetical protein